MWELDHQESWAPKNWCFWDVMLEETLESPLDCKEIKPVHPKANQPWKFIGRTDAEALILWPADARRQLIRKDPDAGEEGDGWGWDSWMTLLTQWTWMWPNFRRQWRRGKPGILQSMGLQRVGNYLATEKNTLSCVPIWMHTFTN